MLNGKEIDKIDLLKNKITDERIKIYATNTWPIVWSLKKEACDLCTWDYLFELDHDDELYQDTLSELVKEINKNNNPDFIYSDCLSIDEQWNPIIYSDTFGWDTAISERWSFSITPEPHPANWSKILFQPNHFRCWKKSFYNRIWWHDISLEILDDQDLICRTYIEANRIVKMEWIFYKQNISDQSTQIIKGEKIPQIMWSLYHKYFIKMCDKFFENKYDFWGWIQKKEWYMSVDLNNADVYCDLNGEFSKQFWHNSAGIIRCHDLLEHIKDPIKFMNNAYDMLIDGWVMDIMVPCSSWAWAFCDPTHVSFWNQRSFRYYTEKQIAQFVPEIKCQFMISHIDTIDYWDNIPTIHSNYFGSVSPHRENLPYVRAHLVAIKETSPRKIKWLFMF